MEDVVQHQGYASWCTEDERSIINLLYNQVQPGEELLVFHLDLVWSRNRFADHVLDDSDNMFYSLDSFIMLGQSDLELNGRELDVHGGDNLELRLNKVLACSCDIQSSVNPNNLWSSSKCKSSLEPHGYTQGGVVV